jgi:hypothetical protein
LHWLFRPRMSETLLTWLNLSINAYSKQPMQCWWFLWKMFF